MSANCEIRWGPVAPLAPGVVEAWVCIKVTHSTVKDKSVKSHLGSCWCLSCACQGRSAGSSSSRLWPTPWRHSWASWCGAHCCSYPSTPWTLVPLWCYSLCDTMKGHSLLAPYWNIRLLDFHAWNAGYCTDKDESFLPALPPWERI